MNKVITEELRRRCNILIENAKPGSVETGMSGSLIRFRMALCMMGYATGGKPKWMDEEYSRPLMTNEEFQNDLYDAYVEELFEEAYAKVNS